MRRAVARAAGAAGPAARPLLPALERVARHAEEDVGSVARDAAAAVRGERRLMTFPRAY